ncbi:MAG: hypothetical protein FJ276_37560 [Planctomycetes bacterium]|nr:hypothetical protein [Planctomycetota bacterium]
MTTVPVDQGSLAEMHCPTCRARQTWSDICRRCKCDMAELHAAWRACQHLRFRCLALLRAGDFPAARAAAHQYVSLVPCDGSLRLLATCQLLDGRWAAALRTGCREPRAERSCDSP